MSEFVCIRKPRRSNWHLLHHALVICADIIKETDFNPSIKQQDTIIKLLAKNISELYAADIRKNS
jgi:hypothetical protein